MPLPILIEASKRALSGGSSTIRALKAAGWLAAAYALKVYFGGARNKAERLMRSKVVMITVSFFFQFFFNFLLFPFSCVCVFVFIL